MNSCTCSAFLVWVATKPEWSRTINAASKGQAKGLYLRDLQDAWPDAQFTELRSRRIGTPHSSEAFIRNAAYRGMPGLRCGARVRVGRGVGIVVGHNASANFDVLFAADSPRYAGLRLNCHPSEVEIIEATT